MDKLKVPTPSNGYPFNWDDIEFALATQTYDGGIISALEGVLTVYGNNFIVSGCEISGGTMAAGWIMLDGELIKVDSHTATNDYFVKTTSYNSDGNKQTQLGSTVDAYEENRATSTAASGNLKNDNRFSGSYTIVTNNDVEKTKLNETINITVNNGSIYRVDLGNAIYEGEDCLVIMSCTSGRIDVYGDVISLYTLTEGTFSAAFRYLNGNWRVHTLIPFASTSIKGVQENATDAETRLLAATNKTITCSNLSAFSGGTIKTLVEIGDWNMDADNSVTITHGISDFKKIRAANGIIRNDADTAYTPFLRCGTSGFTGVGIGEFGATTVSLIRIIGGTFDNTNYDQTSYNRGWLIIEHLP